MQFIFYFFEKHDMMTYNHFQIILEKLRKLRKSCKHKQNINGIAILQEAALPLPLTIIAFKT